MKDDEDSMIRKLKIKDEEHSPIYDDLHQVTIDLLSEKTRLI